MAQTVNGLLAPGNIDTSTIAPVRNPDGSVSTVRSISINQDGKEVLIPTVVNGRVVSNDEAVAQYRKTGKHLGIFDTPQNASSYAQSLHEREAMRVMPQSAVQYSDVPEGATVVHDPAQYSAQYSDIPEGATVVQHGTPPDERTSYQVREDQAKNVLHGIGIPTSMAEAGQMMSGVKEHPLESAWNLAKGIITAPVVLPYQAIKAVGEDVIPSIVKNSAALREAYGGPPSPFGAASTQEENERAAQGAGKALVAAPVIAGDVAALKGAPAAIASKYGQAKKFMTTPNTPITAADINKWMGVPAKEVAHGADPGAQIMKENLVGATKEATKANVDSALGKAGAEMQAKLQAADKSGVTIDAQTPTYDGVAKAVKKIGNPRDATFQAQMNGIVDDIESRYPNLHKLTPSQTHDLKVELGNSINWSGAAYDTPANQAMVSIYRDLNTAIKNNVADIADAQARWGNLYVASKNLKGAMAKDVVGSGSGSAFPQNPTPSDAVKAVIKKYGPAVIGFGTGAKVLKDLTKP